MILKWWLVIRTSVRAVRMYTDDLMLIRTECKKEFLNNHPEMEGMKLTDAFMIKKITEYYLEH